MDITTRNRKELKSYFVKNSIPTESNFAELIDGLLNQKDDGLVKLPGNPLSIEAAGDSTSEKKVLQLYQSFSEQNPAWMLSLNPRSSSADPASTRLGFNISDGEGKSRLFIDRNSGGVGVGTVGPVARLDVQQSARSGTHPTAVKGLYVTGDFGADSDGVEFRHSNSTQGIGFGYNTIYAAGTNANQDIGLKPRGTGVVRVQGPLQTTNTNQDANGNTLILGPTSQSNLRLGYHQDYSWVQSHGNKPLAINSVGNNVGVGTTNPGTKLEVVGGGGTNVDLLVNGRLRSNNNDGGLWVAEDRFLGGHSDNKIGLWANRDWRLTVQSDGNVGIGTTGPVARLDVQQAGRSGTHPTAVKGLYVTGDFGGDSDGVEFRHSNASQGIGFGYNTIYAAGTNTDQDLGLKPRGTGVVKITSSLQVSGYVAAQQVYFSAYVDTNDRSGAQSVLPMKQTSQNVGGAYDTTTSKFTAPVKGVYLFTMTGLRADQDKGGDLSWALMVNDAFANNAGTTTAEGNERGLITWSANIIGTFSRTILVALNKGDKVYVQQLGTGRCDNYRSGLEGVLLYATL